MSTVSPVRARTFPRSGEVSSQALLANLDDLQRDACRTHMALPQVEQLPTSDVTHVYLRLVPDPTLREALAVFDEVLSPVRRLISSFSGRSLLWALRGEPGQLKALVEGLEPAGDVVETIAWVSRSSGLPVVDVLAAADIKERTFHEWKRHGRRPRLSSQGRLWLVVQAVEDLLGDLGGTELLQRWLIADATRRELFRTGNVDQLRALSAPGGAAVGTRSPAGVFALGDDSDPPLPSSVGRTRPVRGTPTPRTTRASAGRQGE